MSTSAFPVQGSQSRNRYGHRGGAATRSIGGSQGKASALLYIHRLEVECYYPLVYAQAIGPAHILPKVYAAST
jgi:hypothetical protein